eukprot:m.303237 g.303237  ORF g.303237 m.303237 type:complete len:224 (-) comp15761_c0_seq1:73-744(-)
MRRASLLAAAVAVLTAASVHAAQIHSRAGVAANLCSDPKGQRADALGDGLFVGNTGDGTPHRAVMSFGEALHRIPADSTIHNVNVTVFLDHSPSDDLVTVRLHRVQKAWGTGTSFGYSGQCAPATADDTTWLHTFYPSAFWTKPGGDMSAQSSADTVMGPAGAYYSFVDPQLVSDVSQWLRSPDTDYGWMLVGDESRNRTARRFSSFRHNTTAWRPTIIIDYS